MQLQHSVNQNISFNQNFEKDFWEKGYLEIITIKPSEILSHRKYEEVVKHNNFSVL